MPDFNTGDLSDKQIKFSEEYLTDLNATQAAIRAGYSEDTARSIGSENLTKPNIQAYIQHLQKELSDKTKLTQQWVLNRFKEISERCMRAEPILNKEGQPTGEYRFDANGANKATEMIGRHLGFFEADNLQKPLANISATNFSLKIKQVNERD